MKISINKCMYHIRPFPLLLIALGVLLISGISARLVFGMFLILYGFTRLTCDKPTRTFCNNDFDCQN